MILSYNEYLGSIENQKQKENEIEEIKEEVRTYEGRTERIIRITKESNPVI